MDFLKDHWNKTIVFAVMNWGLGHATRSIPIIHRLLLHNNRISILSDGEAMDLLKAEFPSLKYHEAPSYGVTYSTSSIWINMAKAVHKIIRAIAGEHAQLENIISSECPHLIISDSRFGCYSRLVKSIAIVHQVQIYSKNKVLALLATRLNLFLLNRFDSCWIMDDKNLPAAGNLSNSKGLNDCIYIGKQSRMKKKVETILYDICVVLSGPEPMRSKLEEKLASIFADSDRKICFVKGRKGSKSHSVSDRIDFFEILNSEELNTKICQSELVICRSGYSSIMDLLELSKKAILIPTPGQTEQEYLAEFHCKTEQFGMIAQKNLSPSSIEEKIDQLLN